MYLPERERVERSSAAFQKEEKGISTKNWKSDRTRREEEFPWGYKITGERERVCWKDCWGGGCDGELNGESIAESEKGEGGKILLQLSKKKKRKSAPEIGNQIGHEEGKLFLCLPSD
ncbi:hypothetical protein CDAR_277821 [Caerostris darwini]|uniref:Uncharacterized protein n=1 Tax=Caerostris darwini TaxID=1538125 RepID=A0AAV4RGF0_9ARAC|nr:hypothetical protein CDAR_277821 [Caerostris darwini]